MARRVAVGVCPLVVLGALFVGGAHAIGGSVHATFTHAVASAPPGSKVAIAWKLRDAKGRAVLDRHVFVKITCPEGDASTTAYANPGSGGTYVVDALVPPGGIGTVAIGWGKSVFPITNPVHG